jgi:tRNA (guanine37-N1)-methyltransferase
MFPEMFPGPLGYSLIGKALEQNKWSLNTINIREYAQDKHANVDDTTFGGGNGMIMKPNVIGSAIDEAKKIYQPSSIIYMSPRGKLLTQNKIRELICQKSILIICGRFEGLDERVIDEYDVEEISLGDFVLAGGEIASLALIEACVRLLPGVLERQETLFEESFGEAEDYRHLLEYPQYTRPSIWKEYPVPDILLSGNHAAIRKWRLSKAQELTQQRRPDLWAEYQKWLELRNK